MNGFMGWRWIKKGLCLSFTLWLLAADKEYFASYKISLGSKMLKRWS